MSLFNEDISLKEEYSDCADVVRVETSESPESLDSYPSSNFARLPLY